MKICYLCNGNACGDICSTECDHTTNVNFALHKDSLGNTIFRPVTDWGGNIIGFNEIEREKVRDLPKEVTIWGLGGNKYELDKGCTMVLYNEDENGDEYDSVYINLKPGQIKNLISGLLDFLEG